MNFQKPVDVDEEDLFAIADDGVRNLRQFKNLTKLRELKFLTRTRAVRRKKIKEGAPLPQEFRKLQLVCCNLLLGNRGRFALRKAWEELEIQWSAPGPLYFRDPSTGLFSKHVGKLSLLEQLQQSSGFGFLPLEPGETSEKSATRGKRWPPREIVWVRGERWTNGQLRPVKVDWETGRVDDVDEFLRIAVKRSADVSLPAEFLKQRQRFLEVSSFCCCGSALGR